MAVPTNVRRKVGWLTSALLASTVFVPSAASAASDEVDLSISKTASPSPVEVGELVTYTVTITNPSSETATGVMGVDILPQETTLFMPADPDQSGVVCTSSPSPGPGLGTRIDCDFGSVGPGTRTFRIHALVNERPPGGLMTNRCTVFSDDDPNESNDHFALLTEVKEPAAAPRLTEAEKKKCRKKLTAKKRRKCRRKEAAD